MRSPGGGRGQQVGAAKTASGPARQGRGSAEAPLGLPWSRVSAETLPLPPLFPWVSGDGAPVPRLILGACVSVYLSPSASG